MARLKVARYYSSVVLLYGATLLFAWYIFQPLGLFTNRKNVAYSQPLPSSAPSQHTPPQKPVISGKPVRIVIIEEGNGLNIDLPIVDGVYDEGTETWTLSENGAHFALVSAMANDTAGNTFIYGHNNKKVFAHLTAIHQNAGAYAKIHTDNGKVFTYMYDRNEEINPDDVSIFSLQGPPMLVVQTCSGSFYEYRRLFLFKFESVENG